MAPYPLPTDICDCTGTEVGCQLWGSGASPLGGTSSAACHLFALAGDGLGTASAAGPPGLPLQPPTICSHSLEVNTDPKETSQPGQHPQQMRTIDWARESTRSFAAHDLITSRCEQAPRTRKAPAHWSPRPHPQPCRTSNRRRMDTRSCTARDLIPNSCEHAPCAGEVPPYLPHGPIPKRCGKAPGAGKAAGSWPEYERTLRILQ